MMNKKGNAVVLIIMLAIFFVVLILGSIMALGTVLITWTADEIVPEVSNLGMVGSSNLSEYAGYTVTPVDSFVQTFSFLAGIIYVMGLVGCIGLAFAFRFTGSKWLMGFFILGMLLVVIGSIFISNIYEDFYTGTNEVATRLQEMPMLSYLLLYSPLVMCIIGFVCGVIMFTGEGEETQ